MKIKRDTQYIKFVSAVGTNANKVGEVMEAWKDYASWHIRTVGSNKVYQTGANMIRTIAGDCIEQRSTVPHDLHNI